MKKVISIVILLILFSVLVPVPAQAAGVTVTISTPIIQIPQHKDAQAASLPNYPKNACYDINPSFKAYATWPNMTINDWENKTGKAGTRSDRVLRQAYFLVTVKNGTAPLPNAAVTVSTTLGTDAYIYKTSSTTDAQGAMGVFVEYFGERTFTMTATASGVSASKSVSGTAARVAPYRNKFYLSAYRYSLRSRFSTWAAFEDDVMMNGTGYDDTTKKWYQPDWSSGKAKKPIVQVSAPLTASGTTPKKYVTIAVDSPYIPRNKYVSDGSSSSVFHRGLIAINGDNTNLRIAEDSGDRINGYHIDYFIEFDTLTQFYNGYGATLSTKNGYHFVPLFYAGIKKG